jgi:hypothetical protein
VKLKLKQKLLKLSYFCSLENGWTNKMKEKLKFHNSLTEKIEWINNISPQSFQNTIMSFPPKHSKRLNTAINQKNVLITFVQSVLIELNEKVNKEKLRDNINQIFESLNTDPSCLIIALIYFEKSMNILNKMNESIEKGI